MRKIAPVRAVADFISEQVGQAERLFLPDGGYQ